MGELRCGFQERDSHRGCENFRSSSRRARGDPEGGHGGVKACGSCFGHSRKSAIKRPHSSFLLFISTIKKFPKSEVNDSAEAKSACVSTKTMFIFYRNP